MAEDQRRVVLRALPALIRVPPDEVNFLRILIQVGFVIARPPPDQLLDLRYRIVNEGRDVFQMFSFNRYSFFETTGETPETLLEIVRQLNNDMFQATDVHRDYHQYIGLCCSCYGCVRTRHITFFPYFST
jgi:hypothetical protein